MGGVKSLQVRLGRAVWARRLAALATALVGVVTLVSSLSPTLPARERLLEALEPGSAQAVAHAIGVAGGILVWAAVALQCLAILRAQARRQRGVFALHQIQHAGARLPDQIGLAGRAAGGRGAGGEQARERRRGRALGGRGHVGSLEGRAPGLVRRRVEQRLDPPGHGHRAASGGRPSDPSRSGCA